MTDLISRAELIDHLNKCLAEWQTPIVDAVLTAIKCTVEQMPTAEPTPTASQFKRMAIQMGYAPVIHCEDCQYNDSCLTQSFVESESVIPFNKKEFYCADAERRNDDNSN